MTSADADLPRDRFSGYFVQGPYTQHPEFLDDQVFWLHHLARPPLIWAYAEQAQQDFLLHAYDQACTEFHQRLLQAAEWTAFAVPLKSRSSLHVVYSLLEDHVSADYHLSHPEWEQTETLAYLFGNYAGYPALSWAELAAAADSGVPGGSTEDPHKRLLLLWPAMGDDTIPGNATLRLSAALSACTPVVPDPDRLASLFVAAQKCGRWRSEDGVRVTDALGSFRTSTGGQVMSRDAMARVSAALESSLDPGRDQLPW